MDQGHGKGRHCWLRERTCHAGLRRLLLATDFSPQAYAAETAATKLAPHAGVVDLVHVVSPAVAARYARWPVMAHATLDGIAHEITTAGGKSEVHLSEGKPSEEINRAAAERDVDFIVVGKHGASCLESMAIGSTAANLCGIAPSRADGASPEQRGLTMRICSLRVSLDDAA